jgi:hypothetical protein
MHEHLQPHKELRHRMQMQLPCQTALLLCLVVLVAVAQLLLLVVLLVVVLGVVVRLLLRVAAGFLRTHLLETPTATP